MNIKYSILDPSGNKTLLVETIVDAYKYKTIAKQLMDKEPDVEQIGFIEEPDSECDTKLYMAGGEFCGNASLCAAAIYLKNNSKDSGNVKIKVSGSDEILDSLIECKTGKWSGSVNMPVPNSVWFMQLPMDDETITVPVVHFKGISHVIITFEMDYKKAEDLIEEWAEQLKVDSLGIMLFDEENNKLAPLVYVKSLDTLFWEHSCASGTTAVAAWMAVDKNEPVSIKLKQPGGEIGVDVKYKDDEMSSLIMHNDLKMYPAKYIDLDI